MEFSGSLPAGSDPFLGAHGRMLVEAGPSVLLLRIRDKISKGGFCFLPGLSSAHPRPQTVVLSGRDLFSGLGFLRALHEIAFPEGDNDNELLNATTGTLARHERRIAALELKSKHTRTKIGVDCRKICCYGSTM